MTNRGDWENHLKTTGKKKKCHSYLQEGELKELQAIQIQLVPLEGDGAVNPGNHLLAHARRQS